VLVLWIPLTSYIDSFIRSNRSRIELVEMGRMVDCIAEPQWADYIGVHCLRGKKPPVEIRQVGITYYPNLPYLEVSQYSYHNLPYLEISQYTLRATWWSPIYSKGNLVHVAPAYAGSEKGSDHFRSYVSSLSLRFHKRLLPGLEPMTSWSQGNCFTAAPCLPFISQYTQTLTIL
jgi:hypothetical protein